MIVSIKIDVKLIITVISVIKISTAISVLTLFFYCSCCYCAFFVMTSLCNLQYSCFESFTLKQPPQRLRDSP